MLKLGFAQIILWEEKIFLKKYTRAEKGEVFRILEWAFKEEKNLYFVSVIIQSLGKILELSLSL